LAGDGPVESDDSEPAVVTPRDTFPPAAPQNVVAAVTTPPGEAPSVDLSWSVNLENDLAGYRVYRSDTQDARGQLLTTDLLPAPAYRDMSVQQEHRYWYSVTAVDRAGNESVPTAVTAGLTQLSQ
jgi:fibronectin type 3 domain-containing protein